MDLKRTRTSTLHALYSYFIPWKCTINISSRETQSQNFNIHAARGPQIKLRLLRSELQIPDRGHRGHAWANLEQPSVILPVLRISMWLTQVLGGREQLTLHCLLQVSREEFGRTLTCVFKRVWIVSKMQNVPKISKNHTGMMMMMMMMMWTSHNESSIVGLCRHGVGSIFSCSSQTKTWESSHMFTCCFKGLSPLRRQNKRCAQKMPA